MGVVDERVTLHFTFISEPTKPVVTLQVPRKIPFQDTFVIAAKKQGRDPSILYPIYPEGAHITAGTVEKVLEHGKNIHIVDLSIPGY